MAASSSDFQWYHDADDEFPIDQCLETPPATNSSTGSTPLQPSVGHSKRVRQLRGQSKLAINQHQPSTMATVTDTTHSRRRRRSDAGDKQGSQRSRKTVATQGRGKKPVAIPVDSEPEIEDTASANNDFRLSSDDDDDNNVETGQDKSVSPCCFIWIPTDKIYYRNASAAIVCAAKTSAVPTSTLCLGRGHALKVVNW
jgi:hypothetical protein